MQVKVAVGAAPATGGSNHRLARAAVTRVAVEGKERPREVPPIALSIDEEHGRFEDGGRWTGERCRSRGH